MMSFAVAGVLFAAAPANARVGTDTADGRCFTALSMAQDNAAKADKDGYDAATMYYMGKIVGRWGIKALSTALEAGRRR